LGIINILGYNFIVGIKDKEYVGKIEGANIYSIKSIEMFPFENFSTQCKQYIDGIKKVLTLGFYFSYNADLTSNR
jgi:hypothetical protein